MYWNFISFNRCCTFTYIRSLMIAFIFGPFYLLDAKLVRAADIVFGIYWAREVRKVFTLTSICTENILNTEWEKRIWQKTMAFGLSCMAWSWRCQSSTWQRTRHLQNTGLEFIVRGSCCCCSCRHAFKRLFFNENDFGRDSTSEQIGWCLMACLWLWLMNVWCLLSA